MEKSKLTQTIDQGDPPSQTSQNNSQLKTLDSGYTFFSFISNNTVIVVGSMKDYFKLENKNQKALTQFENFTTNNLKNSNQFLKHKEEVKGINTIQRLNFSETFKNTFIPVQLSCSKFSIAILFKNEIKTDKKEELKEFQDIFSEIDSCLKARGLTFQTYFMNKISNDILFKIDHKTDDIQFEKEISNPQTIFISELDFMEKITDLINGEKYSNILKKMFDKFKQLGWIILGKVDLSQLYKILYKKEKLFSTKLMIMGDFVKNWISNFEEGEMKENWKRIYERSFIFELPMMTLPIKQVEMGENHLLILTIDGEIFACGDGSNGATGNGQRNFHSIPQKVKFQFEGIFIIKIAAGLRHSIAIDSANMIYSWGCGQHGRLGHGNERDQFTPKLIDTLSSQKITEIDADDTYSASVTSEGELYTWGQGDFGRLGHQDNQNELIPKKVESLSINVIKVKCGYFCTIVYLQKHDSQKLEIFTLGAKSTSLISMTQNIQNENYDDENNKTNIIPSFIQDNNGMKKIDFVVKNENKTNDIKKLPIFAVCGYQFVALISEETHLVKVDKGFDEIEDKINLTNPTLTNNMTKMKTYNFCDLYISGNMNMTINKKGNNFNKLIEDNFIEIMNNLSKKKILENSIEYLVKCLMAMGNFKMQIGEGLSSDENKAFKGKEIKKVVCGDNNTAIMSTEGNLYIFGSYLYKICSDQVDNYTIPVQPKGVKIIHMTLGANHIIMVTNNYEVYGAGRNSEGQLGIGKPSDIVDISNPCYIEKLRNKGINKCFSSENYTVCLSFNNEGYIFGDISFLEKSQFIHYQSSPKKLEWGDIFKIACGPSHILMMVRDEKTGQIVMKAIGNGTYGKLGDDSENEDNRFEPIEVDIQLNLTSEAERKKRVMLRCSRLNSACLIQDPINKEKSKLYIWGLCSKSLFNNPRDIEKYDKKKFDFLRSFPVDNAVAISKPIHINPWNEGIIKIALSDTLIYVLTTRHELKSMGTFFSAIGKNQIIKASGEYENISVGIDHAAAISKNKKLFTWGFNVMNKLGKTNQEIIKEDHQDEYVMTDFNNLMKFFYESAENVTNFNKIFESKNIKSQQVIQNKNENLDNETTPMNKEENITKEELINDDVDNVFSQTQMITKSDYDNLENILMTNEIEFKKSLKTILEDYNFLVKNNSDLQKLKRTLYTQFNFKMADPPINIKLKETNENKLPYEYIKFKRNYKCLLTTLKIHPCYLVKLYEKEYFLNNEREICPKELYKIIKSIFSNIYDDNYSQMTLIILAKKILEIDINKLIKNCKDENDKKNVLENYNIFKMNTDGDVEFNLFGKICKLLFKSQIKQNRHQELLALQLIGQVYDKTGGKGLTGYENAMLIKYHPDRKKKQDLTETYSHQKNQRIDLIFIFYQFFCENLKNTNLYFEKLKNPLFSAGYKTEKKNENKIFFELTLMSKIFISEIVKTLEKLLLRSETDIIDLFITKKFPFLLFNKFIKVLENPKKMLSIDAGILVDRNTFQSFMDGSLHNFYSLAFVVKFCFGILGLGDKSNELCDDEVNKLIQKKFGANNLKQILETNIKQIVLNKTQNEIPQFDLFLIQEFFRHSLIDKSHRINFNIKNLIRLQEVIAANIKDLRVLNEGYDLMDLVFFNRKDYPENFIGEKGGLLSKNVDDMIIQVNLKTRLLAYQTPSTLMKCAHCHIVTLHEFVFANEIVFYKEFKFFNKSSIHGRFINILKSCRPLRIKNDKITDFLKEEIKQKDSNIYLNLYNMATLIAVDNKKVYQVESSEIAEPKQLFEIILNRDITNQKLKDLCKDIIRKYEKMKMHREYHIQLTDALKTIKNLIQEFNQNKDSNNVYLKYHNNKNELSRIDLYERIKKNFEKGYGNPDIIKNYRNLLKNSSKIIKIEKHYDDLPKSKNLMGLLTKEKKEKLLPFRDYELKKLMSDKVILEIMVNDCNADTAPQDFKILIQKTDKSEFVMTLTKKVRIQKSFWACGKSSDINTKKVHSTLITNDNLKLITNKSKMKIQNESDAFYNIDGFVKLDPREFIKILKNLTNVGLD